MSVQFTFESIVLELRNPELSDTLTGILGTAYRISMTGSVRAYKKTPIKDRILMNFTELTCKDIDEIIDFIKLTAGERIGFTDWRDREYEGYIINNPFEVTQDNASRTQFSIEFEVLEVIPVPSLPATAMLMETGNPMLFEDLEIMEYEG